MSAIKHSPELKRAILNEMIELGLTPEEAGERHGITAATIRRWERKLEAKVRAGVAPAQVSSRGARELAALRLEIRASVRALLPAALHAEIVQIAKAVAQLPPARLRRRR